jgi:chorismate mutase
MDLNESRKRIDEIDGDLTRLFIERMKAAAEVAAIKREKGPAGL